MNIEKVTNLVTYKDTVKIVSSLTNYIPIIIGCNNPNMCFFKGYNNRTMSLKIPKM